MTKILIKILLVMINMTWLIALGASTIATARWFCHPKSCHVYTLLDLLSNDSKFYLNVITFKHFDKELIIQEALELKYFYENN